MAAKQQVYQQQFNHKLVGKRVKVATTCGVILGTVERVVRSASYGELAKLEGRIELWRVRDLTVLA
jgi:hypothetical protein